MRSPVPGSDKHHGGASDDAGVGESGRDQEGDQGGSARGSMHAARKRRIWEARGGRCGECGEPVEVSGRNVVYDHRIPLWFTRSDADDGIWPIHKVPCDQKKTPADLARIAKTKRQAKMGDPRPPGKIKSAGFAKVKRPFPKGRGFPKRRQRPWKMAD